MNPKKAQRMMSIGMFAMAAGLSLFVFVHPASAAGKDWLDGIAGFLMGISIALNLGSILVMKRDRSCVRV
jgi:hypothetical protein